MVFCCFLDSDCTILELFTLKSSAEHFNDASKFRETEDLLVWHVSNVHLNEIFFTSRDIISDFVCFVFYFFNVVNHLLSLEPNFTFSLEVLA